MALIIFALLVVFFGVSSSAPIYHVPLTYVALSPIPENIYNQVHDTKSGEYAFGYSGGPVAREEAKTSDGVTRGAYSYVDAHGIVQYYRYVADDNGFRVVGTNIPTDLASNSQQQPQRSLEVTDIGTIDAEKLPEKAAEIASSREKRAAIYGHVSSGVVNELPAAPSAVVAAASVPTATWSQSQAQIHKSVKAEIQNPIDPISIESVAVVRSIPVAVESLEVIPVANAASVTASTSGQSRYQIHNSAGAELHEPAEVLPIEKANVFPEFSVVGPAARKSPDTIPADLPIEIVPSVPTSTSSQSRYQIHNSVRTELHKPAEVLPIEKVEVIPGSSVAARVALKSHETIPAALTVENVPSLPISTSSQSRYQIHNSVKTKLHKPVEVVPIETAEAVPESSVALPVALKSPEVIPATISVAIVPSVPTSTSMQSRYQIHNSGRAELHEPVEVLSTETVEKVPESSAALPVALKSPEVIPATISAAIAPSVPTSTSSQSRYQIHNSVRAELHEPVEVLSTETVEKVPESSAALPVALKSPEVIPATISAAIAPSVPTSTSMQSRYQIHNSGRAELHEPVEVLSTETVEKVPESSATLPVALKSPEVIPATISAAIAPSVPTSTSMQSRYQIHNSGRAELHEPVEVLSTETVEKVPESSAALPVALKSPEVIPATISAAIAPSVPTSTSMQSRYQIHNSARAELHEPVVVFPTETVAVVPDNTAVVPAAVKSIKAIPITSIAVGPSVPVAISSQQRLQTHDSLKTVIHESHREAPVTVETEITNHELQAAAIPVDTRKIASISPTAFIAVPGSLATSTSHRHHLRLQNGGKFEIKDVPQSYHLVDLQPTIGRESANEFSPPSLARHRIGVGLGVVSSPLVAYQNYENTLFA